MAGSSLSRQLKQCLLLPSKGFEEAMGVGRERV
jgi:hypothetical protein